MKITRAVPVAALGLLVLLATQVKAGGQPGPAPGPGPFRVAFQAAVPDGQSSWTDIRWATDNSVFLVSAYHGVREVALDGKLTRRRQAVPGKATLKRFQEFGRLAVSPEYLVVAGYDHNLAWRTVPPASGAGVVFFQHRAIATSQDVDLRGDRLLLLGVPSLQSPQRALIWAGSLRAGLDDLKPLLAEDDEPLWRCSYLSLGAARFLPDGSFLVAPGVRPGAQLFDRNNRLIRTFSPAELGVDTDCSQMTPEEGNRLQEDPAVYGQWMKRHRVLEGILPLAAGPGLLVRFTEPDNTVHWELRILRMDGSSKIFPLPLTGKRPSDRLHADVRNNRIVLLRAPDFGTAPVTQGAAGEIFVLQATGLNE